MKKLYLVSQDQNNDWDTFDSFVVVAESAQEAIQYHPAGGCGELCNKYGDSNGELSISSLYEWGRYNSWCEHPSKAVAKEIGVYTGDQPCGTEIISSFNAG